MTTWAYAEAPDAVVWHGGTFASQDEAIAAGRAAGLRAFVVATCTHLVASEFFPSAETLLQDARDHAYDDYDIEDYAPPIDRQATLDAFLREWVSSLPSPGWVADGKPIDVGGA